MFFKENYLSVDRGKLKQLFSNKKPAGGLDSIVERLTAELPFDVFYVHNVGDVTLPIRSNVFDQITNCYSRKEQAAEDSFTSKACIVDKSYLDSSYCAGFTTVTFTKLARLYLQHMLQVRLDNITLSLEACIDSLVLVEHNQIHTQVFNEESSPGSFGYMLLKIPVERDAGETSIKITYKESIKEFKLDNDPSIFMVSAPCQKLNWQEFELRQASADSQAAFLVFNLIWKNAHEVEQFLMPSELPVFIRETWEVDKALSSWKSANPQINVRLFFLCIPLINDYSMHDFHISTLQGIDLFHARRLISLDYLQVHLAIVSQQKEGNVKLKTKDGQVNTKSMAICRLKWISSVGTWNKEPPAFVMVDLHLVGELTAKMYSSMEEPGKGSSPLCPVQHPVLLIRPKWTALLGRINISQALADLQNRLPETLKELASNQMLLDENLFISDFKQLVSYVCNGNNETVAPGELARLMTMANKLHRFDEAYNVLQSLAPKKYSANDESNFFDPVSVLINNIGWERCSAAILGMLYNSENYVNFLSLAKYLLFSRSDNAVVQLMEKIIEKLGNHEGNSAPVVEKICEFYFIFLQKQLIGSGKVYQFLLSALKTSQAEHLWNGLKNLKANSMIEHNLKCILIDLDESLANTQLDLISESCFLDILKEYEAVDGGQKVIDCLWRSAFKECEASIEELRRAPMIQRLILQVGSEQERSDLLQKLANYPDASKALDSIVNLSLHQQTRDQNEKSRNEFIKFFHFVMLAEEHEQLQSQNRLESVKAWISKKGSSVFEAAMRLRREINKERVNLPAQRELLVSVLQKLAENVSVLVKRIDIDFEEIIQCFLWIDDLRLKDLFIDSLKKLRVNHFPDLDKVIRSLFELRGLCGEPQDRKESTLEVAIGKLERTHILDLLAIWLDVLFDEKTNRLDKINDNYHHIFLVYYKVEKYQPGQENCEISKRIDDGSQHVNSKCLKSLLVDITGIEMKYLRSRFSISNSCVRLISSLCRRLSLQEDFASVIDGAVADKSLILLTQCFFRFSDENSLAKLTDAISSVKSNPMNLIFKIVQCELTQSFVKTSQWRIGAFIALVDVYVGSFNRYLTKMQNWTIPNATIPKLPRPFADQVLEFLKKDSESALVMRGYSSQTDADSFGELITNHNTEWGLTYRVLKDEDRYACRVAKTRKFDGPREAKLRKDVLPVLQDLKKKMLALLENAPPPAKKSKKSE